MCTGKITTYQDQSRYQIIIDNMEPAGAGALMVLLEKRKEKLSKEGVFSKEYKKNIPYLPKTIGVITSPTGAVIRDILHRIEDRFPTKILIWPVRVQGEFCAEEVINAIEGFHLLSQSDISEPEVIIIARGGGSIEDLWGFNDETLVRKVFSSSIPIISAIGHETDTTLIDLVADLRAPTPSAAAEMAVPVKSELHSNISDIGKRARKTITRKMEEEKKVLDLTLKVFPKVKNILDHPINKLNKISMLLNISLVPSIKNYNQKFFSISHGLKPNLLSNKIKTTMKISLDAFNDMNKSYSSMFLQKKNRLDITTSLINAMSHKNVLKRGYAIVKNKYKSIVRDNKNLKRGDHLSIHFDNDQIVDAEVKEPNGEGEK
ncbi:MAG: exodeoxyribonuclease VII large subunit [Rhodobiaceae bacterium]|nr:exodeoxyribonuclease VII large subunit [Rhodobiaceae bacterium]